MDDFGVVIGGKVLVVVVEVLDIVVGEYCVVDCCWFYWVLFVFGIE